MFEDLFALIQSLYPGRPNIFLHEPDLTEEDALCVAESVRSGFVSAIGPQVAELERELAEFVGSSHCLAVVNGTSGLQLALAAAGVEAGDEVITQAFSFVATANAICHVGAHPLFLDIDGDTLGLSAAGLRDFLNQQCVATPKGLYNRGTGRRVVACVPMHSFGLPCHIKEISQICAEADLVLIEDAAEALGSQSEGKSLGSWGTIGVFSFNGNKILTSGGGGALVSDNGPLLEAARHLATTAKRPHPWKFEHDQVAYNLRMPALNAALALSQLKRLPQTLSMKRQLHHRYREFFESFSGAELVTIDSPNNFWLNAMLLPSAKVRDEFLQEALERKIQCRPPWELLVDLPMYRAYRHNPLPVSRDIQSRCVNLPSGVKGVSL